MHGTIKVVRIKIVSRVKGDIRLVQVDAPSTVATRDWIVVVEIQEGLEHTRLPGLIGSHEARQLTSRYEDLLGLESSKTPDLHVPEIHTILLPLSVRRLVEEAIRHRP